MGFQMRPMASLHKGAVMRVFDFLIRQKILFNKHLRCLWFDMPYRYCEVIGMYHMFTKMIIEQNDIYFINIHKMRTTNRLPPAYTYINFI